MERAWSICGMVVLAVLIAVGVALIVSPKRVDGYYLSHGSNAGKTPAVCVYAHWTWHFDEAAFCTDDYQRALDFLGKANAATK